MLVYINYPNPHMTLHPDSCHHFQMSGRNDHRIVKIDSANLPTELATFKEGKHFFSAHAGTNDMWIVIKLNSPKEEIAVAKSIQKRLAVRYAPIGRVKINKCHKL